MSARVTLACALLSAGQATASAADTPLPFPARVESVLERGSIEGFDVSVLTFRSPLTPQAAAARARREWSQGQQRPVVDTRSAQWLVVSSWEPQAYRTLQLRSHADGGSEGLLSEWRSGASPGGAGLDPLPLLPDGANVLRRFSSVDAGRRAESVVAQLDGSVDWISRAVNERMRLAGFVADPVVKTPPNVSRGMAHLYRRGPREALLTLHPHLGRTGVVLHLTEATR